MAASADPPIFHVEPRGGLASRMIQYMIAMKFKMQVPACRIANVSIPEWGIALPPLPLAEPAVGVEELHAIDPALVERVRTGAVRSVVYAGYGHRMENFPEVAICRNLFRSPTVAPFPLTDRHLACPLGSADAPEDSGPFHPLMPAEFYAEIAAETGLTPVFIGHAPVPYLAHLREHLPQAQFLSGSPLQDLVTVMQARNIVVSISTFAWLSAWLSQAERIFLPVSGAFNPQQYSFLDLLPFDDARYLFHLFPINYAVPMEHLAAAHRRMAPFWRPVVRDLLRRQFQEAPRFDPPHDVILQHFDVEFYLAANPDVAQLIGAGNVEGARAHYLLVGMKQHRLPFPLAPAWYAARYPMAALEVAQGDHVNFAHHYIVVGKDRGYRPLPDAGEAWWDDAEELDPLIVPWLQFISRSRGATSRPNSLMFSIASWWLR